MAKFLKVCLIYTRRMYILTSMNIRLGPVSSAARGWTWTWTFPLSLSWYWNSSCYSNSAFGPAAGWSFRFSWISCPSSEWQVSHERVPTCVPSNAGRSFKRGPIVFQVMPIC
jgi:hypothetical protein